MIDWSSCEAVERNAERYSGAWVFRGTRVPVAALFDQGTPAPRRHTLPLHVVETTFERGWSVYRIVVLSTTSWPRIRATVEPIARAVDRAKTGWLTC